ncbi:MAG: glycosyltransferase [Acidobacteriales bacterium]|nr:glycosyltransferase [Terriglobales bacterium]
MISPPLEAGGRAEELLRNRLSIPPGAPLSPVPAVFLMTNSFETGGSERQFAALAQSLDPASFQLHLGCVRQRGSFLEGLGNVASFGLGGSLYGWQSVKTRYRLGQELRKLNVVIAHSFDFYTNLILIPAARVARIPVVIGSQRQLGDLLTRAQRQAQTAMFRWCDAVVCNSQAAADRLIADGVPKPRIVVIGNGLPPSAFAETPPAFPANAGKLRIGMIARMNTRSKHHDKFLRCGAALQASFPGTEIVIVGDGPLRPELEELARGLGIRERAHFLGDRKDIPAILASLDISVLPSASESLSNVILESMAAGVPVVANRVGGNLELLGDDRGILVPPDDDSALRGAVEKLLRDPALRRTLGQNARAFAQSNFAMDHMGRQYKQLYMELLRNKGWHSHQGSGESRAGAGLSSPA